MQALRDGVARETVARFNRPMVYRAIRPLARFHDDYRAIDEVLLNSTTLEASSRLSYGTVKRGGQYHTHPAIIDSLTQSCGFTMNCNDRTDLDNEIFMNHGWGSLQIFEPIDFDKTYTTYTRMDEGADKLWHGDVVIFDGDKVVAFFGQISVGSLSSPIFYHSHVLNISRFRAFPVGFSKLSCLLRAVPSHRSCSSQSRQSQLLLVLQLPLQLAFLRPRPLNS